ncbi:GNAT family N-acetyltransferase [Rhizobium sp. DKSPLA3]|uniref:GNAT family N-acetyltransferase n=1 Tax=Rhizobium quercicola TaxID=2901226 RepID=A0A9X1T1Q0_9HYPH|nr:GNAT family N-acetyltransferase [Rhizobium quercicola]MCD7110080.1 GNAT family N-acetyltransferase [Rhizobium quercicola]
MNPTAIEHTPAIRRLTDADARAAIAELSAILIDCIADGASVGFLSPFGDADAARYWAGVAEAVAAGQTVLFAAEANGAILGTVQLGIGLPPNQPHRADLKKLLVHRRGRGRGLARLLMTAAEREALALGRHLLVLDTATGSPAEAIYTRLGWSRAGVIPDYALFPDGSFCSTTLFYKSLVPSEAAARSAETRSPS